MKLWLDIFWFEKKELKKSVLQLIRGLKIALII